MIPQWAQNLVLRVAIDEGRDDLPDIIWRRSRKHYHSSGNTSYHFEVNDAIESTCRIAITAGRDHRDHKLVLLHELAHWLCGIGEHHSARFWDKAWQLYRRYRVPIRFALESEGRYRKAAVTAYRRKGTDDAH